MVQAGIVIDKWKLGIFTRHLQGGFYTWTEADFSPGVLVLKVQTEDLEALGRVVRAANEEAAKAKKES